MTVMTTPAQSLISNLFEGIDRKGYDRNQFLDYGFGLACPSIQLSLGVIDGMYVLTYDSEIVRIGCEPIAIALFFEELEYHYTD